MRWPWRKRKSVVAGDAELDRYVSRERREATAMHEAAKKQTAEVRELQAESSAVHKRGQRIREQNHFTSWVLRAFEGFQGGK